MLLLWLKIDVKATRAATIVEVVSWLDSTIELKVLAANLPSLLSAALVSRFVVNNFKNRKW